MVNCSSNRHSTTRVVERGKNMNTIAKIKPTDILYRNEFDKVKNLNNNFFDSVTKYYPNYILDIFENQLDENSEEIKLLNSDYFKLINEDKYLNFIVEVFRENSSICYVEIPAFKNYSDDLILRILDRIDLVDRYIILNQIDTISSTSNSNFEIKDKNLLKMFFKCILREIMPIEFYFLDKPLIIFNNFDMSLPIVFKNKEDIEFYKKIAKRHSLFFR